MKLHSYGAACASLFYLLGCAPLNEEESAPAEQEPESNDEPNETGSGGGNFASGGFAANPGGGTGGSLGAPGGTGGSAATATGGAFTMEGAGGDPSIDDGPANLASPKIVILGDSITEQDASWIHPLQDRLLEAGCDGFELIGYDASPYNGPYSSPQGKQHKRIAAGGFSSRGIRNWIEMNDRDFGGVPDVVIQYLGVNNVYGGFIDGVYNPSVTNNPGGAYVEDTADILAWAREQNSEVAAFLMKIQDGMLPEINTAIDQAVSQLSTEASPVFPVDGANNVSNGNDVHPNAEGAENLASPISAALITFLMERGACE